MQRQKEEKGPTKPFWQQVAVGLFGWMALDSFVLFPGESIATWNHWFQMQIGMIVGFFASYPANWLLLRNGLKKPM